jgi:hypothetical protein
MPNNREIVRDAVNAVFAHEAWTVLYEHALPMTPQNFELSSVLPAVMYMTRYGKRRGAGEVHAKFADPGATVTIRRIADVLSRETDVFTGFDSPAGQAILGDLLLTWCLENTNQAEGQEAKVARVFPTHFFASWVDLPGNISDLRGVPELITAALASQQRGEAVRAVPQGQSPSAGFPVGVTPRDNPLLRVLASAVETTGHVDSLAADQLNDALADDLGIDELLMARLARKLGQAPRSQAGQERSVIPNRRPASVRAAIDLRDDLLRFVRHYGARMPRQSFIQLLECGITLGMTQLMLRSARAIFHLQQHGDGLGPSDQHQAWQLFVDCSEGRDRQLRLQAELSMEGTSRQFEQLPRVMMVFRILHGHMSRQGLFPDASMVSDSDPTRLLEFIARAYRGDADVSNEMSRHFRSQCLNLAAKLREHVDEDPKRADIAGRLASDHGRPVDRLAAALCDLMGDKQQRQQYVKTLDSSLGAARVTGLASRRRTPRDGYARSAVMHTPMLDYLVHLHLAPRIASRSPDHLSLRQFLNTIRERHGLCIDRAPGGMRITAELLSANKSLLEARLRDLGLLVSVNDAESLKTLRSRYE